MKTFSALLVGFALLLQPGPVSADQLPLHVLYLARTNDDARTTAFVDFLKARFERCTAAKRIEFDTRLLEDVDVVLLDWSQSERTGQNGPSPLGPLETWDRPTVLLGSAGLLISAPWSVIGGAGWTCLDPQAYVLRPHEVLQQPSPVDTEHAIQIETPQAWRNEISSPHINVVPLVDKPGSRQHPGWCTYTYEHSQAPELEVILGGVNSKTPRAVGIWRQGHLLHFGFEQSPGELNASGRALLVNSICYIARFTEDRPIVRPPAEPRLLERTCIERLTKNTHRNLDSYLDWFVAPRERELLRGQTREQVAQWYQKNGGFLRHDERGQFTLDDQARQLAVPPNGQEFIPAMIAAWEESSAGGELAPALLSRYVAGGPDEAESPADWRRWWEENKDYLFFTDTGGCRWHIDPLAKNRGVPTAQLRGSQRATRKPVAALR